MIEYKTEKDFVFSSQIVFLYFENYDKGCEFLQNTLGLKIAYNPGWACVYRTSDNSFIGAVDSNKGSIATSAKGGVLISLTVKNIEEVYEKLKHCKLEYISEIKAIEDVGLRSFFLKGPEGYDFEIQEFTKKDLKMLF